MWYFIKIKTPVIIPAHNEEHNIVATLSSLPRHLVEPIVAVNGSADLTEAKARDFGARVIKLPEQGKLPAIQATLRALGKDALGPVLILDADTQPVFPRRWHDGMVSRMDHAGQTIPEAVGGPVWFTGNSFANRTARSLWRFIRNTHARASTNPVKKTQSGPNMGIHLKDKDLLEEVLTLPHYWPGEDRAIMAAINTQGGQTAHPNSLSLLALTAFPQSLPPLSAVIGLGVEETRQQTRLDYIARGAPGSTPFTSEFDNTA